MRAQKWRMAFRRHAAPPQAGHRRHARIIPARHEVFLHQLQQLALAHHRVAQVQPGEFDLLRMAGRLQRVQNPVIQRPVNLKLQRANRVRDAFDGIRRGNVRIIMHRVDAPLACTGAVVVHLANAIDRRIAQEWMFDDAMSIFARSVPGSASGNSSRSHARKQIEVFLHRPVAIWAILSGRRGRARDIGSFRPPSNRTRTPCPF